jgi:membrane protease YdiL (CAAX protease family)
MKEFPSVRPDNTDASPPAVLRAGIYTGALLVIVMLGALVAANRIPALERYALERNAISYGLFMLFMLIPVARFWNSPLQMFGSAMIGWTLFAVAYDIAGMVFQNLFDSVRHTPLMALCEGAVIYGVSSVLLWVGGMVLHARHHPIRPGRKAASETARHSR